MHARSTTIQGRPDRIDDAIDFARNEAMPILTSMPGCAGVSLLVERESGRVIVTSSWETAEDMSAADEQLRPLRARGAEIMDGTPSVELWEMAVMHRAHAAPQGACCRVTWLRLNHTDPDRGIELYRTAVLPDVESIEGFCSTSLMVDRERGRACSTTTYDSLEAMAASRDRSWALRESAVREAGVDVIDVAEFELLLAHLRVPEMA